VRDKRLHWRCNHPEYQNAPGVHFCRSCGIELGPYFEIQGWEYCGGERCRYDEPSAYQETARAYQETARAYQETARACFFLKEDPWGAGAANNGVQPTANSAAADAES